MEDVKTDCTLCKIEDGRVVWIKAKYNSDEYLCWVDDTFAMEETLDDGFYRIGYTIEFDVEYGDYGSILSRYPVMYIDWAEKSFHAKLLWILERKILAYFWQLISGLTMPFEKRWSVTEESVGLGRYIICQVYLPVAVWTWILCKMRSKKYSYWFAKGHSQFRIEFR